MDSGSFTARRSAASNLPTFQLPPPDLSTMHKYPAYAATTSSQAVASVLTPPVGLPNDLSPISSSVNSGSSGSSTTGIPPYNPQGYWPSQHPNYSFNGTAPQVPSPYPTGNSLYMGRQFHSPQSMSYNSQRGTSSPTASEGLPPPPYELNLPPFPSNGSGNGQQSNLPNLAPQQHQQQMANMMSNLQQPASQAPQHGSIHAPDNYGGRPPPTPTYSSYGSSSTPSQPSFPSYTQASPSTHSPVTSGPTQSRISPVSAQGPTSMQPPQGQYSRSYGNGYPLPAMSGPIMSNMHNPGNQMAMVGGMNMGYPQQHMQHNMYGQQQQQQNDRPFKCDQCPQSFNRNHDLKRHKRIHLAVKPFPCTHCEKSFSRKDALKRHILVKGCGKTGGITATVTAAGSQSPVDKSEVMSNSSDDDSPEMAKKDL